MSNEVAETSKNSDEEATEKLEEEKVKEVAEKPVEEKKVKKGRRGVFSYYKVEEQTVNRLRPFCERCGPGYFMADHSDRYTCGHCGFTRYKRTE